MLVRIAPPAPGASISIAQTKPDKEGCVMIDLDLLGIANSHGWYVKHETELVEAAPAPAPVVKPPKVAKAPRPSLAQAAPTE